MGENFRGGFEWESARPQDDCVEPSPVQNKVYPEMPFGDPNDNWNDRADHAKKEGWLDADGKLTETGKAKIDADRMALMEVGKAVPALREKTVKRLVDKLQGKKVRGQKLSGFNVSGVDRMTGNSTTTVNNGKRKKK